MNLPHFHRTLAGANHSSTIPRSAYLGQKSFCVLCCSGGDCAALQRPPSKDRDSITALEWSLGCLLSSTVDRAGWRWRPVSVETVFRFASCRNTVGPRGCVVGNSSQQWHVQFHGSRD